MKLENTTAQMRKGVLDMCVLALVSDEPIYPSDMIARLKSAELIVVEGTLYPLLSRLTKSGLVDYHWQESKTGPPRKYYKITDEGASFLSSLMETWDALKRAVQHSLTPLDLST